MKLLIELPSWLGDTVMATPAIESLFATYPDASITIFGSYVSTEVFKAHPRVNSIIIDNSKSGGIRILNIYHLAKEIGHHDIAVSFRSHIYSRLLLYLTGSKKRFVYNKKSAESEDIIHQVEKYYSFISKITKKKELAGELKLYWPKTTYTKPTLGINPGATYGSAKRWYPEKFADVAASLSDRFDIIIFGGPGEKNISDDIEDILNKKGIENFKNMAGKTTIPQLCSLIAGLELFITGDSGPMHIAAAYQVPTVSIFGPTRFLETSQWLNKKSNIVRRNLPCSPCMKRHCPIKTHECMKEISAEEVINSSKELMQ